MDRAEFMETASPPCPECGSPISTTEVKNQETPDGWMCAGFTMVCTEGHRTKIEPFEEGTT